MSRGVIQPEDRPCADRSPTLSRLEDVNQEWAVLLSDRAIRRTVSLETYRRGAANFHQGRVSQLKVSPNPRTLFATVTGKRPMSYQTIVTAAPGTPEAVTWSGRCTLPDGRQLQARCCGPDGGP